MGNDQVTVLDSITVTEYYILKCCDICKAPYAFPNVDVKKQVKKFEVLGYTCDACARKQARKKYNLREGDE